MAMSQSIHCAVLSLCPDKRYTAASRWPLWLPLVMLGQDLLDGGWRVVRCGVDGGVGVSRDC